MGRYVWILVILFEISICVPYTFSGGIPCSGYCTKDPEMCKSRGGKIIGLCTNTLACCDPLISAMARTCGETKIGPSVHFKSPSYPSLFSGDLNCDVKVKLNKDTMGVRIDFIQAEMDGQSYLESDNESGSCDSDMIFLRGFGTWGPSPRCGNLSGYSFLIERETPEAQNLKVLTVLALMSSPAYRWHIRILQLSKGKHSKGEREKTSIDYEMPFIEKRSLLTPSLTPAVSTDDNTLSFDEPTGSKHDSAEPWQIPILNGENAVISLVPWQASIRLKLETLPLPDLSFSDLKDSNVSKQVKGSNCSKSEGFHYCGGVIIGTKFILSAAHCFYGTSKTDGMIRISSIKVVLGDTNVCTDDSVSKTKNIHKASYDYDVESITLHYAFDSQLIINDIALIRLKTEIKTLDHIKPIQMAKTGDSFVGKEALLSGWGSVQSSDGQISNSSTLGIDVEEADDSPDILQASRKFFIQNQTFCNQKDSEQYSASIKLVKRHPKYSSVFNSTLCTSSRRDNETDEHVSAGRGDSGGPLVVTDSDEEGTPILVGVVSYGVASEETVSCRNDLIDPDTEDNDDPIDYHSSVAFYRSWIDLSMSAYDNMLMYNM